MVQVFRGRAPPPSIPGSFHFLSFGAGAGSFCHRIDDGRVHEIDIFLARGVEAEIALAAEHARHDNAAVG